jgi:hypothetical protein
MSLVRDYGYETNGQRLIKDFSIPEITPTVRRIETGWVVAIEAFPDAIDLRLNYGHFLMDPFVANSIRFLRSLSATGSLPRFSTIRSCETTIRPLPFDTIAKSAPHQDSPGPE